MRNVFTWLLPTVSTVAICVSVAACKDQNHRANPSSRDQLDSSDADHAQQNDSHDAAAGKSTSASFMASASASASGAPNSQTGETAVKVDAHQSAPWFGDYPKPSVTLPPVEPGPRIYSKRRHVWIFYEPNSDAGWTGFLGLGGSVALRSERPMPGPGCGSFYPVKPRGWVCLNDKTTLDPNDKQYQAIRKFAPKLNDPFPHHYGESRGFPRYRTVPTREQQFHKEYQLREHLQLVESLRNGTLASHDAPKSLQGVDVSLAGVPEPAEFSMLPANIPESRNAFKPLSTVSWSYEFDAQGRTWLVTGDLALVPKDKVAPYPRSTFHGVMLGRKYNEGKVLQLPVAFVRYEQRLRYKKTIAVTVEPTGKTWNRLAMIPIENEAPVAFGNERYYRVRHSDELVKVGDVTVARVAPFTPWGEPIASYKKIDQIPELKPNTVSAPQSERRTWLQVSVLGGWLIAYENTTPVFTTLIAPGRGGVPTRGVDPLKTASTPVGTFRVDGKFYTSTMANNAFVHSDVPYAQNFHGPHVLHQAYWHDDWGEKKSGGCVNLAPIDALWLFHWTEPSMPDGWFGMRSDKQAGAATIVWVHE